jgi:cation diffusion facilitator CzcD-associated flavoprotein CzcO
MKRRTLIIGAGFGGIAAAIELQRHGFTDVMILERAAELGGTWHYNTYPGAACDVPSHLYSFSYAQRRDWSRLCSPQDEILEYLRGVAREHDLERRIVTETEVRECRWDSDRALWEVSSTDGRSWQAEALVIATGQLHRPSYPRIEGIERFAGHSFHSAGWDHEYDLSGRRVAVVGTGASAVQFIPEIQPLAERLLVFQRSPNWLLPRRNRRYPIPVRAAIKHIPGLQTLRRRLLFQQSEGLTSMIRHPATVGLLGRFRSAAFMRWQLRDPEVRRRAWPDYTFGCKRVLFSSSYLPTIQRPNVELIDNPIAEITETGLRTDDGAEEEVDCIIWATGFRTNDFISPMNVIGAGGRMLCDEWNGDPHAHLGITVPGFPSMFLMYGPNTNTSGGSIIFYLEMQAAYIRQALELIDSTGAAAISVRPEVEAASDREIQAQFEGTAWTRCDSWYRNESGRIVANWPGYMREYAARTERLEAADFELLGTGGPLQDPRHSLPRG